MLLGIFPEIRKECISESVSKMANNTRVEERNGARCRESVATRLPNMDVSTAVAQRYDAGICGVKLHAHLYIHIYIYVPHVA